MQIPNMSPVVCSWSLQTYTFCVEAQDGPKSRFGALRCATYHGLVGDLVTAHLRITTSNTHTLVAALHRAALRHGDAGMPLVLDGSTQVHEQQHLQQQQAGGMTAAAEAGGQLSPGGAGGSPGPGHGAGPGGRGSTAKRPKPLPGWEVSESHTLQRRFVGMSGEPLGHNETVRLPVLAYVHFAWATRHCVPNAASRSRTACVVAAPSRPPSLTPLCRRRPGWCTSGALRRGQLSLACTFSAAAVSPSISRASFASLCSHTAADLAGSGVLRRGQPQGQAGRTGLHAPPAKPPAATGPARAAGAAGAAAVRCSRGARDTRSSSRRLRGFGGSRALRGHHRKVTAPGSSAPRAAWSGGGPTGRGR